MSQTLQLGDKQVDGPSPADVCQRYGVKELSLFRSAVRGEMRSESDIDMLGEFEPGAQIGLIKFESLVEELESLAVVSGARAHGNHRVTQEGWRPSVSVFMYL